MSVEAEEKPAGAADPEAARLGAILFRPVPAEDLALLGPAARERLAAEALAVLRRARPAGAPAVELVDLAAGEEGGSRDLTALVANNDDRRFLLDSTLAELGAGHLRPALVSHPILAVERDGEGRFLRLCGEAEGAAAPGEGGRESLIVACFEPLDDPARREALLSGLRGIFAAVGAVAADADAMRAQLEGLTGEYVANPPPLPEAETREATAFLRWLGEGHFTLLGMRASRIPDREGVPEPLEGSGLGLLRDPDFKVLKRGEELVAITPEIRAFLERPEALIVTKASVRSPVGRRAYLDYVGAKLFSGSGRLWGELAIVGSFTGFAYAGRATETPYLRRKVAAVLERSGFDPASFAGRSLLAILEEFPRDELFQIDADTLDGFARDLLRLSEHPRLRVLSRVDRFDRFVSVMVFLPRERYASDKEAAIGDFLARAYGGRLSASYAALPDGPLARTHFIIGRDGSPTPVLDRETLENGIAAIARTWGDALREALAERFGGARGRALAERYGTAFSAAYREAFEAGDAVADVETLERLSPAQPRAAELFRRDDQGPDAVSLKLFSRGANLPLSERVPLLERMGFRVLHERTYEVEARAEGDEPSWLHDMALVRASGAPVDVLAVSDRLEAALLAVFRGVTESDGFNKLVLEAGMGWRDAAAIRTLGRYLRQIVIPYGQEYLADVLARHGRVSAGLAALLYARFDPALSEDERTRREAEARAGLGEALSAVTSLEDDRILRRFLDLLDAAIRTNFFLLGRDGLPVTTIAFKFACAAVDGLPRPVPLFEIFMNGPTVEALHLRFGHVARGGLRWSDRPQDYRTEVLGLVKAQQVKNAVIVPVGAKGGFFPKRLPPPGDRAAWLEAGTDAYRIFVRTLLDVTDNLGPDGVVPPPGVVRHDGPDPYLVVAADKGTATFSDIANAISLEKGHWLGDAFASGGSHGYDHKAMGITARGAWEAVKRHFREMNQDIGAEPVTVVGVGDMSGDVFGNAMLLSSSMKLVAAFDHRDIFLDPDPDPAASFAERRRLFELPRSSWADYDRAVLSAGGGVFPRSAKTIPLSPEIRAALGFDREEASPAEVMSAILRAPVGLLWFGGIGTYVRSSAETDAAANDRANDPIRITGAAIRAKVVGEGANLGMTQRGRIEAALAGIRLNTDAIDNSAGVNTSDVEVNIKIALAAPLRDGRLSPDNRNALLAEMTEEVASLVLRNNYLQTLALSLAERRAAGQLGFQARLMGVLEASGRLDRALEDLPDEAALSTRRAEGRGLTRPELAVLLAYAKLALHDELLASRVPDDPYLSRELERYFPAPVRERFPDAVAGHRLRREIIATQLANAIVNRGGPAVVTRLTDETGADAALIAAAYAAARDSYGLVALLSGIDALDGRIGGERQLDLYLAVQDLLLSRMVWFIRNVDFKERGLDDVVGQYRDGIAEVEAALDAGASPDALRRRAARAEALERDGVPAELGRRLATLPEVHSAPDIVLVARRTGRPVAEIVATHFAVTEAFQLGALAEAASAIPVPDHYDRLARDRAVDALDEAHRRLTAEIVARGEGGADAIAAWRAARGGEAERIRAAVDAIVASGLTVSKLTVAASLIGDLAKA